MTLAADFRRHLAVRLGLVLGLGLGLGMFNAGCQPALKYDYRSEVDPTQQEYVLGPGDIVEVVGTGGPGLTLHQGGDWSVPYAVWRKGSALGV